MWRNAAKRRMRAICRELGGPWAGCDVLFLAKRPLLELPYDRVKDETRAAVRRAVRTYGGQNAGEKPDGHKDSEQMFD